MAEPGSLHPGLLLTLLLAGCPKAAPESVTPIEADSLAQIDARGTRDVEPRPLVEAPAVLLTGATVMTVTGETHAPGWVLMRDGRIEALGAGAPPSDLGDAHPIDVSGYFITPGLIDTHSHLGVYPSPGANAHSDGNEASNPTTPGVWAEHSVWPQDPGFEAAVAGGITTLQILPGSANLIGGRGVIMRPIPTRGSRAMRFEGAPETLKMACGENPKRVYGDHKGGAPSTRMGNLRGQRAAFAQAEAYLKKWQDYAEAVETWNAEGGEDEPEPPERDLEMETLAGVLEGRVLPQVHCYRADDMVSFLQVADEFGFQVRSFHHALEAYKIRDILAEQQVAVSTWADWWGFKLEAYDGIEANAAMVHDAGGIAIIHSDSATGIQRLNQETAKALRAGREAGLEISEEEALRWITWNPAWALGLEEETGSLEPGKRGDLVVWSGHPFSVYSAAELVFIDGALRYDRSRRDIPWSDFELGWEVAP
ncbi:MAG: amidohydrolase [Alphaproteobacteria bacterium]|nr:amidohydrolase [Alphaproteobacteria bacterium]MCB9796619.1 amidohydrolase [Alphaproteobacteria bacterium]